MQKTDDKVEILKEIKEKKKVLLTEKQRQADSPSEGYHTSSGVGYLQVLKKAGIISLLEKIGGMQLAECRAQEKH